MPRPKTCGGAISPPALALVSYLGIDDIVDQHRVDRIHLVGSRRSIERPWPAGAHGIVVRRDRFDRQLLDHARACGAAVLEGYEAHAPIIERGLVAGVHIAPTDIATTDIATTDMAATDIASTNREPRAVRAPYVIVADGANSRFGRTLGTWRDRRRPYATAINATWPSERHTADAIEIVLALEHPDGHRLSGYGWVFPTGAGTVDIGVGVWSNTVGFRSINTSHLLTAFVGSVAERWQLSALEPVAPAVSGRIPLGGAVGPIASPTTLVVGDAAGVANPVSGSGIDTALATGAVAASVLSAAIESGDPTVLQEYPRRVAHLFGRSSRRGRYLERVMGARRAFGFGAEMMMAWPWLADRMIEIGVGTIDTDVLRAVLPASGSISSQPA